MACLDMNINQSQTMSATASLDNALQQLQLIFPTLALPSPLRHPASLADSLTRICQALPVPDAANNQCSLASMRIIIDQQEYKYQRSLLLDHSQNDCLFEEEECFYEQASTGVLTKKDTDFTHCQQSKGDMVDDVWGWKEEKNDPHEQYLLFID